MILVLQMLSRLIRLGTTVILILPGNTNTPLGTTVILLSFQPSQPSNLIPWLYDEDDGEIDFDDDYDDDNDDVDDDHDEMLSALLQPCKPFKHPIP